jgi:hypothetical protein
MVDKVLLIWWRTSVFNPISLLSGSLVKHRWESLLPLLASVETVPAVVHECVKAVLEALMFCQRVGTVCIQWLGADPDGLS